MDSQLSNLESIFSKLADSSKYLTLKINDKEISVAHGMLQWPSNLRFPGKLNSESNWDVF